VGNWKDPLWEMADTLYGLLILTVATILLWLLFVIACPLLGVTVHPLVALAVGVLALFVLDRCLPGSLRRSKGDRR
jgi:hypothetical protein